MFFITVGYVQLKRSEEGTVTVLGEVVTKTVLESAAYDYYSQKVLIDEKEQKIISAQCNTCQKVMCGHIMAFLFWIHRKTEDGVIKTNNNCYWMESLLEYELSSYVLPIKKILKNDVAQEILAVEEIDKETFVKEISKMMIQKDLNCALRWHLCKKKTYNLASVHEQILEATKERYSWEQFYKMAKEALSKKVCQDIREKTRYRYNDPTWYIEMRYGRISSSKVYDCMSKEIPFEKLYKTIMGFHKEADTIEINRKRKIELNVRQQLEFHAKCTYENPGFFIDSEYPMVGVVPDGICDTHVVEIKCPVTEEDMSRYITDGQQLTPKYYTEMQVQMYITGKEASVVCVADPKFEENKSIYIQTVSLDREYARNALKKAQDYWRNFIFPYELTKWCVERDDAKTGGLPSLSELKYLDPKCDPIEITQKTIIGNGTNGKEMEIEIFE